MKEGPAGAFYIASEQHGAERTRDESLPDALRDIEGDEAMEQNESACVARLARLIAEKLIDPASGKEIHDGAAPEYADVQNILTSYVLKNGIIPHADTKHHLVESNAMDHLHVQLSRTFASMPIRAAAARVLQRLFSPESLTGVESAARYVLAREPELAKECEKIGEAEGKKGRVYFRILANAVLDARHEVDAVELLYEVDADGAPTSIRTCALVQVKSQGFVLDTTQSTPGHHVLLPKEEILQKCESIHAAHEAYASLLKRYPIESLSHAHGRELYVADHGESVQAAGTISELLDLRDAQFNLDAAWQLVEEAAPEGGASPELARLGYYVRLRDYVVSESTIAAADGSMPETPSWYEPLVARLDSAVRAAQIDLLHTLRGVGSHDTGIGLPDTLTSAVRMCGTMVSSRSVRIADVNDRKIPALLYRAGRASGGQMQ